MESGDGEGGGEPRGGRRGASGKGRGASVKGRGSPEELGGAVTNRLTTHPRSCFHGRLLIFEKLAFATQTGKLFNARIHCFQKAIYIGTLENGSLIQIYQ